MEGSPYDTKWSNVVTEPAQQLDAPSLWNPTAAGLWSILLTPTFGSYLLWKNWAEIGDADKTRSAKIWLILSIVMIPPSIMSGMYVGLVYLVVWHLAFHRKQVQHVQSLWGEDYIHKDWVKPLQIGFLIFFSIIIALGAMIAFVFSKSSMRF